MEGFTKILNDRGLKQSSIKTYTTNLKKLLADLGVAYDGGDFIKKNKAKILALLENKGKSVRKNYLSVMLIILSPVRRQPPPQNKAIYDELNGLLLGLNEKYSEQLATKELSVKEADNFITWAEIVKKRDELLSKLLKEFPPSTDPSTLTKAEKLLIQDLVILSIYTFNPPRRLIYAKATIITEEEMKGMDEDKLNNLVSLVYRGNNPVYFHIGKLATKSKAKRNIHLPINGATFKQLLKLWRKVNRTGNLLYNQSYAKISENYLTQALGRIFKKVYGKNISVVMLRKIFLSTNQFATGTLEEIAEQMNHSVSTQQAVYTKRGVSVGSRATSDEGAGVEESKAGSRATSDEGAGVEESKAKPKVKIVFKKKKKATKEQEQERINKRDAILKEATKKLYRKRLDLLQEYKNLEYQYRGRYVNVLNRAELKKLRNEIRRVEEEIRRVEQAIQRNEEKVMERYYPNRPLVESIGMEAEDARSQALRKTDYSVPLAKQDLKSYASNVKLWELTPLDEGWLFIDRDTKKIFYTTTREGASLFQEWGRWDNGLSEKVNADPRQFKVGKKRKYLINQKWKGINDKKI